MLLAGAAGVDGAVFLRTDCQYCPFVLLSPCARGRAHYGTLLLLLGAI